MKTSVFNAAAAAALSFAGLGSAADAEAWKSRSIYQVMIDRFARTDGSTTADCELHLFCNGTWAGLINHLDYIQDAGFTAIQISPIVKNIDDHTAVGDAYHGYWSIDNYAINERFGTEDDFKNLVAELHKRDMFIMVDVVVNNMVQAFDNVVPPKIDYSKFKPFDDEKYFHDYCNVTNWEDKENYQNCWLYPYGVALADLKTEDVEVSSELNKWVKDLVEKYDIDGLRIDAAKHINDEFLGPFVEASGVFAFGEVLTGLIEDFCPYQEKGYLPGMPNYLDFYPLTAAFNGGSFVELENIRNDANTACPDVLALGTFVENHDMPRFASQNQDPALAANAMTYTILNDGIPTVYQGQEQHFNGSHTPSNREPLWLAGYNKEHPLYVLTSKLNNVRNNAIKKSKDYISTRSTTLWADVNHFCTRKGPGGSQVVFCINNKSSQGDRYQISVGGFQPNDNLVEVVSCGTLQADGAGNATLFMYEGEPRVLVNAANLEGTDICPGSRPAHAMKEGNSASSAAASSLLLVAAVGLASLFLA